MGWVGWGCMLCRWLVVRGENVLLIECAIQTTELRRLTKVCSVVEVAALVGRRLARPLHRDRSGVAPKMSRG